jgi:hypothetical protein
MSIEHVYVLGHRHDLRFTQCCVASIRRWYPEIPISLLKDESRGAYDTSELESAWNVRAVQPVPPRGWAKLEPLFLPGRQRCLILDSDIVFAGRVIDTLEAVDADFVVEAWGSVPERTALDYYDPSALAELDPEFVFPGYTFNAGQLVATTGVLQREDFEPFVRFGDQPEPNRPDVFRGQDQGLLNYVLQKKAQLGELTLERVPFMVWGPTLRRGQIRTRNLTDDSPYRCLVHWAGGKARLLRFVPRSGLLRHFEAYYYSRIPAGRRTRAWRSARRLWRIASGQEPLHTRGGGGSALREARRQARKFTR